MSRAMDAAVHLFPSEDGNEAQREQLLGLLNQLLSGFDRLKDADRVNLKGGKDRSGHFYGQLAQSSRIPEGGVPLEDVTDKLLELMHDHPYHTKYFLTNILPMASVPGMIGMVAAMLANGNNLWDVYGPAGAEAEVRVISMMSQLVGYDHARSGGYTTWGGQGAIFTGLRLAIAKFDRDAPRSGVTRPLYAFCSEAAHYSLFKSMEATGLGSDRLIKIRTLADSAMDPEDLRRRMGDVIAGGGIPAYIVATTGTTDAMGIDDLRAIAHAAEEASAAAGLPRPHIHADSALGGFFAFYNDYDFDANPLGLDDETSAALASIAGRLEALQLADSLCFDFQKLGQTPYCTSLFLVKDSADLQLLDLDASETPYVGHRGYGQYHTGYTLECSRMASSISMYSALLAFGKDGYRRLLAQFVSVNHAFRRQLAAEVPELTIVNPGNPGIITLFRLYGEGMPGFEQELAGVCSREQIERTNALNERFFEQLGRQRDRMFFGDTKKHLLVPTVEGDRIALYASKLFVISPYTRIEHVPEIVRYLKTQAAHVYGNEYTPIH
ncbi:pyridoxal phosphate-dependent decarboxylase family protein [Paenibacillus humicola]|uniref:pyridoxal phosphate-dependent decarboxylase family protein n=1 Tax=Paenibacillus humicola TaxID=3110540 RepID=UPI00237ADC2E|nr:pyridoxal-dependent decarboxylase [Paenibacillus humicola]